MPVNIPYKSFCWGLGTTSFRTKNFNKTIEKQLDLLNDFWNIHNENFEVWAGNSFLQEQYYDFMKEKGFVSGDANNKPKDAREKTSGLVDIGLISPDRKITAAGRTLLEISKTNDFSTDNMLQISKDSYIYLKQLLKTYNDVNGKCVRPFVVLLYVLSKVDYLSYDEFTYLLPLCIDEESTKFIVEQILNLRNNTNLTIDSIIIDRLMSMDNYKIGLDFLIKNKVDVNTICTVGMNRKSRSYDKPYFDLYNKLYEVFVKKNINALTDVFKATKKVNIGILWRGYLFNTSAEKAIANSPRQHLKATAFDSVKSENEFKKVFYEIMHLLKAKATLSDYLDLNRRYIKTTDIILFDDDMVKVDIVPKQFFNSAMDNLYKIAFIASENLYDDCALEEIDSSLVIKENVVIDGINKELGANITNISEAYTILDENRYRRLQHLIDSKFTDDKLITLLNLFETRADSEINSMVTDNADIPTIFEYILGILWYKASERKGKILDYMKLSLDADLLPKTHAAGGEADIVYEYAGTEYYPKHTLLLEATLADGTNQRRMEMEPVSRHLGQHLIRTRSMNSYCVFATNYLNINVIADFRGRKNMPYYDPNDYEKCVEGMKIIPLQTSELKSIVSKNIKYKDLYKIFDKAYNSELKPHEWYEKAVREYV